MDGARSILSVAGITWGAVLPALAVLVMIPPVFCGSEDCPIAWGRTSMAADPTATHTVLLSFAWAPYVDDRSEVETGDADGPRCRESGTAPSPAVRLTRFEFPSSFSPFDFATRELFACVLTAADGRILDVRLPQPVRGGAADRALVATIARRWRFQGASGNEAGWQRVRINIGAAARRPSTFIL
jgi:hypothetical protein